VGVEPGTLNPETVPNVELSTGPTALVMEPEPVKPPAKGATAPETEREWGRDTEDARDRFEGTGLAGIEVVLGVDDNTDDAGGGAGLATTLHICRLSKIRGISIETYTNNIVGKNVELFVATAHLLPEMHLTAMAHIVWCKLPSQNFLNIYKSHCASTINK
jgi:hypothetical protein